MTDVDPQAVTFVRAALPEAEDQSHSERCAIVGEAARASSHAPGQELEARTMSDLKTRTGRHRASGPADVEHAHDQPVGEDGLTDSQRRKLRVRFRSGMGYRPDPAEFKREADEIAEKLAGLARYSKR